MSIAEICILGKRGMEKNNPPPDTWEVVLYKEIAALIAQGGDGGHALGQQPDVHQAHA